MRSLLITAILLGFPLAAWADLRYFDDATLRSIQFVDAKEGWAVGDEGVVWHTIDGGQTWERQPTGVRASLRSVHFPLPYNGVGWIAGREELPQGGSVGVLLYTKDAGVTWKKLLANALPGLNQVRFTDAGTGFIIGDSSDQFSTGVFRTTDGGRTWEPVKGPRTSSWHAGEFQDAQNGILAGTWSRLATFRQEVFSTAQVDPLDGRSILGLKTLPQVTLAVGQGGLILSSVSGGSRWGFVDTKLPRDVLPNLDFHTIHSVGFKVWIAGRPGSFILHSADQGANWKLLKTGHPMPLHGLYFLDENRGWAVGEGGTILTTANAGQSWTVQHQGGKRAAVLFVHAGPEQLAGDTLARLGAHEGYLAAAVRLAAPDPVSSPWNQASAGQRFAAGTRLAGGLAGEMLWQFPLPQHLAQANGEQILGHWNTLHGGDAHKHILRQLVLAVRQWRPSVVIGDPLDARIAASPVAALIAEALQAALVQAADPRAFPEQIEHLGLAPWRVDKLYVGHDKKDAQVAFDANAISGRLQGSFRDYAAPAARILTDGQAPLPSQRLYRLVASAIPNAEKQAHFLDGLAIEVGEARRKCDEDKEDPQRDKVLRASRNLVMLAENLKDGGQAMAQIGPMLNSLPDDQAAQAAFAIASSYARRGQWHLAREVFLVMVERYPTHPQSLEACRWLIRHASSSEARRRHELGQFLMNSSTAFQIKDMNLDPKNPSKQTSGIEKTVALSPALVKHQTKGTAATNDSDARHWYRGSLEIGKRLGAFGPLYAADPAMQFCLQSSRRHLGEANTREWYEKYVNHFPRGPWHDAAAAELWLTGGSGLTPKRVAPCRLTDKRPYLDGNFDDPCWQNLKPLVLENAVGDTAKQYPTEAWFAYDPDFIYIALRCQHPPEKHVPPVKDRPRDANLEPFDRVSILLDLDRDYGTYFQLQIDQRGCVREDCWGDVTWDPRWFVAVKSTPQGWCIEAAMPRGELTGEPITLNSAWACNVVRTLPGRGVQAWSLPADVQPRPEGMGLLIFQQGK